VCLVVITIRVFGRNESSELTMQPLNVKYGTFAKFFFT